MTLSSMKSMGAGIGGVIVLGLFCSTFMSMEKVMFILPLFVGFAGAMTGFQLVDLLREQIRGRFVFPLVMGAGQGAVVFCMVSFVLPRLGSHFPMSLADLAVYMVVSGITSVLGARLAVRYLDRKSVV